MGSFKKNIWRYFSVEESTVPRDALFDVVIYVLVITCLVLRGYESINPDPELVHWIEGVYWVAFSVFLTEWVLRVWSCTESSRYRRPIWGRLKYASSPMMLFDLMAILPVFLFGISANAIFMRILRIFEVSKYLQKEDYSPLTLITKALASRKVELSIIIFTIMSFILICSYAVYLVEKPRQPEILVDIVPSVRWAFSVITGYGTESFTPITVFGQIVRVLMIFLGATMVGLPVGLITSAFIEQISLNKRSSELRAVHSKVLDAFDVHKLIKTRSLLKTLEMSAKRRYFRLDRAEVRLGLTKDDIIHAMASFGKMRLATIRFNGDISDTVIIESFETNRGYGICLNRNSDITVVSTQNS